MMELRRGLDRKKKKVDRNTCAHRHSTTRPRPFEAPQAPVPQHKFLLFYDEAGAGRYVTVVALAM